MLCNHHFQKPKVLLVGCSPEIITPPFWSTLAPFLFRKHTLTLNFIHFYIPEISENSSFKYVTKLALGVIRFLRGEPANWPFSSKHQCTFSLLPSSTAAMAALGVVHKPCESYNGELLWVSLQGTKNKQFKLPFFWLNQGFLETFGHLSVVLSQHED